MFLLLNLDLSWKVNEHGLPHHASILEHLMHMTIFPYSSQVPKSTVTFPNKLASFAEGVRIP